MRYVRFPLSFWNMEDLLHKRDIDIPYEAVRFWWNRFGKLFAAEICRRRVSQMRAYSNWQWHLDEVFLKINGETHYLWWAVDHEGEVLESFVTKRRDRKAALKLLRKAMKIHGNAVVIVTDKLRSCRAVMKVIGHLNKQKLAAGSTIGLRIYTSHLDEESGSCFDLCVCEV
jgi:putative transposase